MVKQCLLADTPRMTRRIAASALWFLAVGWGFNYLSAITGVSPILGMAIAGAVGTFVGIDPLHLFWPVQAALPAMKMPETALPVSGAMQTQV
jgi:hypothetical protein